MLDVEGLTKVYGDFMAVKDLTFSAGPGELLGLVGPNGAGKTTTLRCLAGIFPPTRGRIVIGGHDLQVDPVAAKRGLAYFPDEPRLFEHLTIRQHLRFIGRLYQVGDVAERSEALLAELDLVDKADQLPGELSRGMRQKVQLACGLLHGPQVLLFDEPLTGLDPFAIRYTKDMIRAQAAAGRTIVISSHLLGMLEEICTRVLILGRGVKLLDGTLAEFRERFATGSGEASLEDIFLRVAGPPAGTDREPVPPPLPTGNP